MRNSSKANLEWQSIFENYLKSGLTKIEFCRENNISKPQFLHWAKKLRPDIVNKPKYLPNKKKLKIDSNDNQFLAIKSTTSNLFTIKLSNGMELRFSTLPSGEWLADMITKLDKLNACTQ